MVIKTDCVGGTGQGDLRGGEKAKGEGGQDGEAEADGGPEEQGSFGQGPGPSLQASGQEASVQVSHPRSSADQN